MSEPIKFLLNGALREVSGLPPTTTVLQYLRLHERLTGTKEGCAEGDCGSCTVIIGDLEGDDVVYRAVNACILFLPVLDGKQVLTIESMKSPAGGLHPVQQAMVDCHGSQCGFCTPGFVMSLGALLNTKADATETDIHDAVAGNLCRCTGYRPILEAACKANGAPDRHLPSDASRLKELRRKTMFSYETENGKFFSPVTADELAEVMGRYPEATLLSGGTDIGLWVTKQHRELPVIIYVANIVALRQIVKTQDGVEIGAAASYARAFDTLAAYDESLEELLRRLGSAQIRNSGTLGGNIANGSPIGDGMPPLIALGARLVLRSKEGLRETPLEDYFIAYKKQDRRPGEFIEKIFVPCRPDNVLFKAYKVSKRFDQDISAVCAAFALTMQEKTIASARIAFGGMAATPKRAAETEKFLQGKEWTEETAQRAMALLEKDYAPLTDMRASAAYRALTAQNLLYRFYLETAGAVGKARVYGHGG